MEYSTCAVYARNKYFCFLHKCCCQPITNIFALDLDTNTCIRSRSDLRLSRGSRSNLQPLDLDLRLSRSSRSNLWPLDLDLRLSRGSRSNPRPLDLDLRLSCGSRSNLWPLDLDLRLGRSSRSNPQPLDLDLRLGCGSRSNPRPLDLDLRLGHSSSNPYFRCHAHFWPKWRAESLIRGLKILCLKIANALPWSCTNTSC